MKPTTSARHAARSPRKHADVIKAWADGAEVEYRAITKEPQKWSTSSLPTWSSQMEYRVKPKVVRYRLYLVNRFDGSGIVGAVSGEQEEAAIGASHTFVRWIGQWQEEAT